MLLLKALAAPALLFSLTSATPAPVFVQWGGIHQVKCWEGAGTAFEAGNHMVSVNHVTSLTQCKIDGKYAPAKGEPGDFSIIAMHGYGYRVNCGGFVAGETVYAVGYADGLPRQRILTLTASGERYPGNGEAILIGYPAFIPGMSGGPVFNVAGEVVGTVNMYMDDAPISLSRELKSTSLCR